MNRSADLLEKISDAHGGQRRFERVREIQMTVDISGLMWKIEGYPGHRMVKLAVRPFEQKVTYWNALGDGDYDTSWIWTPTRVWKETINGIVIEERDNPRHAFEGHNLFAKWDDLHLLYFMEYAIWNYVCDPFYFTWPGMEVRRSQLP